LHIGVNICLPPFWRSAGKIPSSPEDLYGDIVLNAHRIRSSVTISAATDQLTEGIHLCLRSSVLIDVGVWFMEHPGKWTSNRCSYASSRDFVHSPFWGRNIPTWVEQSLPSNLYMYCFNMRTETIPRFTLVASE